MFFFSKLFVGPTSVYWIAGDQPRDEKLISTFMSISQHEGDRLRRVFPISQHDYSIEVVINRDVYERTYSCVIGGTSSDVETTLFTYIVRSISNYPSGSILQPKNFLHFRFERR